MAPIRLGIKKRKGTILKGFVTQAPKNAARVAGAWKVVLVYLSIAEGQSLLGRKREGKN
jgi:hypothetical protein